MPGAESPNRTAENEQYKSNKTAANTLGRISLGSAGIGGVSLTLAGVFAAEGKPVGVALFGVFGIAAGYLAVTAHEAGIECFKPERAETDTDEEALKNENSVSHEPQESHPTKPEDPGSHVLPDQPPTSLDS